ncbi:hypothetical protein BRADI_3g32249v3, partial [Brachypodium distachyon]
MSHRKCLECLDRSLKDLLSERQPLNGSLPFGGLPVVLGGDFRQVLPVMQEVLDAALCSSPLWHDIRVFSLRINMRLQASGLSPDERDELAEFASWVLNVGDSVLPPQKREGDDESSWVCIPPKFLVIGKKNRIAAIVDEIYDSFLECYDKASYLADRAIVCPTNSVVDEVNDYITAIIPSEMREYLSADGIAPCSEQVPNIEELYPVEFLNSIAVLNYPQHRFYSHYVFEGVVLTGLTVGQSVCVPRIVLNTSCPRWPFVMQRRQFPVRVCYAMTISKSQGQTLAKVGLYLTSPMFTHGQLYVVISRVTSPRGLR